MLCVDRVAFGYTPDVTIIAELSFEIGRGDVVAIVGRNGAGKSTLLRLLNGLLHPLRGEIRVNGKLTSRTPVHLLAREIGTVFQAPEQQIFNARVDEEIAFGPRRLGLRGAALRARVETVLERVGLSHAAARHPLDLDAAALRFVAIGSVLAMTPAIILLDEPQRGLDAAAVARLEALIEAEAAAGTTVIVVCHDMDFVARRARRVLALRAGELVSDCPTGEFFADPARARAAGVDLPEVSRIARELNLAPVLTPAQLAAGWIAHVNTKRV